MQLQQYPMAQPKILLAKYKRSQLIVTKHIHRNHRCVHDIACHDNHVWIYDSEVNNRKVQNESKLGDI